MTILADRMSLHHRECDALFADADNAAARRDWAAAKTALERFHTVLEAHFRVEENTIFPRFERVTGIVNGPTRAMRMEHVQMREAVERMFSALDAQDTEGFGGESETMLVLMQQHNVKEESVLYPMCDYHLADELSGIEREMLDQLGEATR